MDRNNYIKMVNALEALAEQFVKVGEEVTRRWHDIFDRLNEPEEEEGVDVD